MSDIVIQAENLGKKYTIGHQTERGHYVALRDVLVNNARTFWRTTADLLRGRPIVQGNDLEEVWALKDVSFEIRRGETVGIIGRNGAGKSTLLKVLSRITEPSAGRVTIKGRVASLLEVGTGFHPELTGRENVYLNGAILGMSRAEVKRKFDEIVAFAEIEKFLDTPVKRYSSGMYVRLAFAVAAHLEPEILLVDEVLAVGDAEFQKKCLGKMEDVAGEGRTVLFVSHNMGAVSSLCERGILLQGGCVQTIGQIDSVVASYVQESVASGNSVCLVDHPNRVKGRKPLLTAFSVDTSNGIAHYGAPLTLRIAYDFTERLVAPRFVVIFRNLLGVRVFTLISSQQSNNLPSSLQGKGELVCKIDALPLMPGSYYVDLRLWQTHNKLDDIDGVSLVQVEWLDRDFGQFNWNSNLGLVYVDADWEWHGEPHTGEGHA